jgi:DNA-binding beta-propeller fold protein YncE
MTKKVYKIFCILGIVSLFLSCSQVKESKKMEIYWPLPPEKPRVKWVGWLRGGTDVTEVGAGSKFLDTILGDKEEGEWLGKPYGVHASGGRVYVSDTAIGKVAVFDLYEKKFFFIGEEGLGILSKPSGVTTDKDGYIYVTDTAQDRAIVYHSNGAFSHALGEQKQFEQPAGIAVNDTEDMVYVVDVQKHGIQVFQKDGKFLFEFGQRGNKEGEFNFPTNIFIDKNNKVYVSDSMNFRVQVFDKDGNFLSKFGEIGDILGKFARPKGIAVDSDGNIYVADAAFNNVQIFDQQGNLLLVFGTMGVGPGMFWLPAGMYIDDNNKIYVADQYNSRINIFQYLGD